MGRFMRKIHDMMGHAKENKDEALSWPPPSSSRLTIVMHRENPMINMIKGDEIKVKNERHLRNYKIEEEASTKNENLEKKKKLKNILF